MKLHCARWAFPVVAAFALSGCGTPYTFSPYIGQQQNWATAPGGFVRVVDNAKFYMPGQLPERPYFIIGSVQTDNEENLAKAVREQHADAAMIYTERTVRNGSVMVAAPGVVWAEPTTARVVTANLIKFK